MAGLSSPWRPIARLAVGREQTGVGSRCTGVSGAYRSHLVTHDAGTDMKRRRKMTPTIKIEVFPDGELLVSETCRIQDRDYHRPFKLKLARNPLSFHAKWVTQKWNSIIKVSTHSNVSSTLWKSS